MGRGNWIFATLLSLRGIYFLDARYNLNNFLSLGAEAGIAGMSVETGDESTLFLDLPLRVFFRIGREGLFAQAYAGYYLCITGSTLSGFDIGAKVSTGGLYIEASYIIGELSYSRFAIGYALNDIIGF